MITKELLLKIKELKLIGIIENMDEIRFTEYCSSLDMFIEDLTLQEDNLKRAFNEGNHDSFCKILYSIKNTLTLLYADDLISSCDKLINDVENARKEVVEAYLTYFLTSLTMLSIDIQMAQYDENKNIIKFEEYEEPEVVENDKSKHINKQMNILAVDDIPLTLTSLKLFLKDTKYNLIGVSSAESALKFIANHTPDLFILDVEMPIMNGFELASKIREEGHTAPIIFLTGSASQNYVFQAIQLGAADFIVKPINKNLVLEKIEKYIG